MLELSSQTTSSSHDLPAASELLVMPGAVNPGKDNLVKTIADNPNVVSL